MPHRLEIALKPGLFDAEGEGVRQKAKNYFGFQIDEVRTEIGRASCRERV